MTTNSQNQTWLDNLRPVSMVDDEKVRDSFLKILIGIHLKSEAEAKTILDKEALYYKKALNASEKLKSCTIISLYSAFTEIAIQGISIQPGQKAEAYLEARGINVGTKTDKQYVQTCNLAITAYGELNMRIKAGQIVRMKNPIVLYEGDHFQPLTNQRGELFVDYRPAIPRKSQKIFGSWVCIELPGGSLDFKWLLEDDIERLKNYSIPKYGEERGNPNALYKSVNGGIDPGFLEAKTIKHAMRAYTKLRVADNVAFEGDEDTDADEHANPFTNEINPDTTHSGQKGVKVEINTNEPF